MLTNSWLRTGQLYLTHHHIFSPRPTYFARSAFVLPVLGLFAPVFCCQSYLLTLTFTAFVNPTLRGFPVLDTQLYLSISQKKRVFCRCFRLHCSLDKDFRLLLVLSLLVNRFEIWDLRCEIGDLKKATPLITPGARDDDSELFSRSVLSLRRNESGGFYPGCFLSVCLRVITGGRFYNFNNTIASSQLGNKLSKVAKSSAK
jgi:hypothetical protein